MAKILFIDDDTSTLSLMEKITQILGHQAFTCPQANQALSEVQKYNPDLIMVDVNMQELNGFDVIRELRKSLPENETPILLLSASDPTLEAHHAIAAGANGYLPKPLTIDGLSKALQEFNNNHHH